MKRLILMRHAKSDWSASGDDHSRPLNARGRDSAPAMGRWLKEHGWLPDEVLCSTATRTRQTLALLGLPEVPTRFERALYLAEADEIIETLRCASSDTVLLLGHNYGIAECANALVEDPPDHPRFADYPTCATCLIQFNVTEWSDIREGTGTCLGFAIPREVIAAGEAD
ncbi:MAG: histidine phosphatase family protein [Marivita sp.]|uniref:SixA phosphatase family protein n=1 Tax=Marivita sp. TaxID=2003365 RepID=UPI001B23DB5A|nr:histidine phosphatase family protein [Marivita sp.]MBO6884839.1 histidine phosphatase family protein [Marivita sp.]